MKAEELKRLQDVQDRALIRFWNAADFIEVCEDALYATRERLALSLAKDEYREARTAMSKARMEFLKARVGE